MHMPCQANQVHQSKQLQVLAGGQPGLEQIVSLLHVIPYDGGDQYQSKGNVLTTATHVLHASFCQLVAVWELCQGTLLDQPGLSITIPTQVSHPTSRRLTRNCRSIPQPRGQLHVLRTVGYGVDFGLWQA